MLVGCPSHRDRRNYSLKIKSLGRRFLGHQGRDIPDPDPGMSWTKMFARHLFLLLDREWPGCPAISARMSRDQKDFIMQENFGLISRPLSLERKRKGGFVKGLVENVPSFQFFVRGNMRTYPPFLKATLFENHPFANPRISGS